MSDYIKFDKAGLDELFSSPGGPSGKFLARVVVKVQRQAIRLCPVDTGYLHDSITHELGQQDQDLVGRVGTNVHYAPYVELGTRKMHAKPFLRPSLDAARGTT